MQKLGLRKDAHTEGKSLEQNTSNDQDQVQNQYKSHEQYNDRQSAQTVTDGAHPVEI